MEEGKPATCLEDGINMRSRLGLILICSSGILEQMYHWKGNKGPPARRNWIKIGTGKQAAGPLKRQRWPVDCDAFQVKLLATAQKEPE